MKKISKIVLASLIGATACNLANASSINPEKLRSKCISNEKTRWVEKTQTCVPVWPCSSKDEGIKRGYCIGHVININSIANAEKIIDEYTRSQGFGDAVGIERLNTDQVGDGSSVVALGVRTSDGSYFGVAANIEPTWTVGSPAFKGSAIREALWAYGAIDSDTLDDKSISYARCADARLLAGELCGDELQMSYDESTHKCTIK